MSLKELSGHRDVWGSLYLLPGLRVCWLSMTDADYHSWRKPITLVIAAPLGLFSVE